jgi:hypothetical protein
MGSTNHQRHSDSSTTVSIIRGMILSQSASKSGGEGVRTEVSDDGHLDRLEVRLFIGRRSTVISFAGIEVAKVLGDAGVRQAAEGRIAEALDALRATAAGSPHPQS